MQGQLVDNNTYNIIQALASNLEAIEAYRKYASDGNRELWEQASQHVQQVVQLLMRELPNVAQNTQSASSSMGATASSGNLGQSSGNSQSGYGQQSSTGQGSFGQSSGSSQNNQQY